MGYGYLEAIERAQAALFGEDVIKAQSSARLGLGEGEWAWVGIMAACGLVVGTLKLAIRFPANSLGFFAEVKAQHVVPSEAPKVVAASLVSLCGGVALGPEAAMGSLGGGLAQLWSERRGLSKEMTQRHVVNGMAAAMGPLFPSPIITVTTMSELGRVDTMHADYMRSVAMMTMGASSSFGMYFFLKDASYLPFNPVSLLYKFEPGDQGKAIVIGVISGLVGFLHIVVAGLCKRFFLVLGQRIRNDTLRGLIIPTLGGAIVGLLCVWTPLGIGSGSTQATSLIKLTLRNELSASTLFASCFAKSLAFGVSKGAGFVGGSIFPMVFIGSTLGLGLFQAIGNKDVLPSILAASCFTAAVPASIAPMPVSLLLMIAFSFQLGAYQSTPIFVAIIAAHLTTCGLGLVLALVNFVQRRQQPSAPADVLS